METLRHLALNCCITSSLCGLLTTFWPGHSFRPVINAAAALYILLSLLRAGQQIPWATVRLQLRSWESSQNAETLAKEWEESQLQTLTLECSAAALQQELSSQGICCAVKLQHEAEGEICIITLAEAADTDRAQTILQENAGSLPWRLQREESG